LCWPLDRGCCNHAQRSAGLYRPRGERRSAPNEIAHVIIDAIVEATPDALGLAGQSAANFADLPRESRN